MKQEIPDSQSPALLVVAQDSSDLLGYSYEQGWLLPGHPEAEGTLPGRWACLRAHFTKGGSLGFRFKSSTS